MLTPVGAFKALISERERINRTEFGFYTIYSIIFLIISLFSSFFLQQKFNQNSSNIFLGALIVFFITYKILQITSFIKRGHDFGVSGVVMGPVCLFLAPIALVPLLLIPGTKKANSYGPSLRKIT